MRSLRTMTALGALGLAAAGVAPACISTPPTSAGPGDAGAASDATLEDASVDHARIPYDGATPPEPARTPVAAETVSTRTDVQQLMFAAGEMQISGEPFAQFFAGRNLGDYDRTYLPPDRYLLNNGSEEVKPVIDLFGFSTAVESYEYSKYHMNMVAQMTSAGLSLANGPLVARRAETTPLLRLRARAQELLQAAGTDVAGYAQLPAPPNNPLNYLGFQGVWPEFFPFKSFDPAMLPAHDAVKSCTFSGGYGGIPTLGATIPEYECAYNLLHLPNRDAQVDKTLVPGVVGLMTWKEALWSIDFTGRLHDAGSNPVNAVADADRASVGKPQNQVTGTDPPGAAQGTYLGSTPLEGMWGFLMLAEMDNAAELLVSSFNTADGVKLDGFASKGSALAYDYTTPLRWFPAAASVVEDPTITPYPGITSMAVIDATSRSTDLAALLLGNAMFFGMTDPRNAGVGQRIGLLLSFDGAPFPADDGLPDGEETAHDRTLAVLRVALVDLDRMHHVALGKDAGVLVDAATVANGLVTPAGAVTTASLAHVVIALRQTLLSLNGVISQYGGADPDPSADLKGILNTPTIHPPAAGAATTVSARVRQLIVENASFVRDVLTQADGTVANGATIAAGAATPVAGAALLESQAAALRTLVEAFLVTGEASYGERASAVARRLETAFYDRPARMFIGVEGGPVDVRMTPERFAWLQSALRETHKTLHVDGDPALGRDVLEERIARVNKLFLNGWDDLNGDRSVDLAKECLKGRLQLAEQSLTGELGRDDFGRTTSDRDGDCVIEIDDSQTASVMASEVHFHSP